MPLYFKNLYWRVLLFIFYQGYRICMCLTWGFLIFVIIHAIPQLFGNSHGFGNSMEHNIYLPIQRRLIMIIFFGDMILSYLSLAAACSTASIADLLLEAGGSHCPPKLCGRYQLSAAMAFLSWFLSFVSFLFNFWLFSSL
ncbi:CASP-like protein 5C1 [Glycine soja]